MRNFQSITKKTTIPQHEVGEFIWRGGMNIRKTTQELYLDNISLSEDSEAGNQKSVSISGYPTNVLQAMANVRYKYCDILEWDVLLARGFKVEKWEIIVDLPNGLKWVVTNAWDVANNQIRMAKINTDWNNFHYTQKSVEIQVLDILMLQDGIIKLDELLEQQQNTELSDFAKKLMKATWQTEEKKQEKKRSGYLKVEVLPQIREKTIIDKEQIPHFIWSKWKNIKFLQDKFNVILKINNRNIEIIGSEVCVIEAKKEIERIYKDTVVEAEIISKSWCFVEIKLPNWDKKGIHDYSNKKLINGAKVQVIIFDKGWDWEKIELLETDNKKPEKNIPKVVIDKSVSDGTFNKWPESWFHEIEVVVFCRINATNIVLKMPEGFNKRISINPDCKLDNGDKVKVRVNRFGGGYKSIELID